jgi:hypothetical protein
MGIVHLPDRDGRSGNNAKAGALDEPSFARCFQRFALFCRLIRFDKRGTELSDREAGIPSLGQPSSDTQDGGELAG